MAKRRTAPEAQGVADGAGYLFGAEAAPVEAPAHPAPQRLKEKKHFHGHRERLRARFADAGAEALADYELLELLLFRVIPRADTKALAKALIARFGDFSAVLAADPARIAEVDGAGAAVALELKAIQAAVERAGRIEAKRRPVVSSWAALTAYVKTAIQHETREQFRVLFLDRKNQLIRDEVMNEGTIDHAPVYPREVVRRALELGAASMILVHNHPSGDPTPSAADLAITREIVSAGKAVGTSVHDHVVVGRHGIASFRALGLM